MKIYCYILCLCIGLLACKETDLSSEANISWSENSTQVDASCNLTGLEGENQSSLSRGLVGQITTQELECNFLRIGQNVDGVSPEQYKISTFEKWEGATIVNSEVLSSPDNTADIYFRSIVFYPTQTYDYYDHDKDETTDPVAGVTRMVGWYPRTYEVPLGPDGKPSEGSFDISSSLKMVNGKECVEFKNKLDGETDVMVTDMREGRMQIAEFENANAILDYDVQPYGHIFNDYMIPGNGYKYCNYFTFNHYLSAVRLYIRVDESDLSLIAWKNINDVIFVDQPSSVAISLPTEQSRGTGESTFVSGATPTLPIEKVAPVFGQAEEWFDKQNMPIIRTALSSNPDYPEFGEVPTYPVEMQQAISMNKTYLGYMLIQPGVETPIEIHTDAGVFNATIPTTVTVTGNDGMSTEKRILEQGCIYNIVIDMKANGTIDVVVGNEDFESFKDLSPYNDERHDFEFANCFIIDKDKMKKSADEWYEGFYFQAMTAGRGSDGVISNTADDLYPKNVNFDPQKVRILWQSEPALITHVELIHGYVRFILNEQCRRDSNPLQGNAVLAVYDKDDNILWSWHIWVVNGVDDITYTIQEDGSSNTRQIEVMNMNLGAMNSKWTDSGDALDTYGLYYQWGRKDPSPGPPSYNYSIASLATIEYYYMDQGARNLVYRTVTQFPTLQDAISHPLDLIASANLGVTYSNDWLYKSVDYLWGGGANGFTKKTIYDPCPYGYRVAYDELSLIFENARSSSNVTYTEEAYGFIVHNNGQDNYFPFAGWKGHDRGRTDDTHAWYEVGNLGDYQDARISDGSGVYGEYYRNHRGRSFLIKKDMFSGGKYEVLNVYPSYTTPITLDYANRASASPVRCVRYAGAGEEPKEDTTTNP